MRVYRFCDGISELRFEGSKDDCIAYINSRGDFGKCFYSIEDI